MGVDQGVAHTHVIAPRSRGGPTSARGGPGAVSRGHRNGAEETPQRYRGDTAHNLDHPPSGGGGGQAHSVLLILLFPPLIPLNEKRRTASLLSPRERVDLLLNLAPARQLFL